MCALTRPMSCGNCALAGSAEASFSNEARASRTWARAPLESEVVLSKSGLY